MRVKLLANRRETGGVTCVEGPVGALGPAWDLRDILERWRSEGQKR